MKTIKLFFKQILNLYVFRIIVVQLLRNNLINRRFKNLIELNGLHNIYKSQIKVFNVIGDAVTRDLCIFGIPQKEKKIFDKFIHEISNADSFLDVGAGIGLYTLFAHEHNKNIQTLSIEPNPEVFKTLKKNLNIMPSINKEPKVLNKVVSCKSDQVEFYIPTGDDFSYGTSKKNILIEKKIPFRSLIVETTNLSGYESNNFEVIKIDVEGSELDVLKTINPYLKNCRLIFVEIMKQNKLGVYELLNSFNLKPIIESKEEIGNYVFKKVDT